MIADVLPPESCVVVAPKVSDKSEQCIFAAAVVGNEQERAAAEAWARAHGLRSGSVKGGDGQEQMITFMPGMPMAVLSDLCAAWRAGKFGSARLQLFIAPKATSDDGIDLDTEAVVVDVSVIAVPPGGTV